MPCRDNGPARCSGKPLKPKAPRVTDVGQPGQGCSGSGRRDSPPRSPKWHADGNRNARRNAWDRPSGRRGALPTHPTTQFARQVRRVCQPVASVTDHIPKRRRHSSRRHPCCSGRQELIVDLSTTLAHPCFNARPLTPPTAVHIQPGFRSPNVPTHRRHPRLDRGSIHFQSARANLPPVHKTRCLSLPSVLQRWTLDPRASRG